MADPLLKVALVAHNQPGHQSLGLGYLRAYAEASDRIRRKVAFQTLDLSTAVDAWRTAYRVLRMEPDVVGFSVCCWNADIVYAACELIRRARPGIVIVLGGPEVGPHAHEVLAEHPAVDAVVRGEGEVTFAELLRVIGAGQRMWLCPGVTARNGDEIVSAAERPLVEELDELPSPYLAGVMQPSETLSFIETFRGCPHRCGYCFEAKGSPRIRSFSRQRVRAEIQTIASARGVAGLSFVDPVFNLTPQRLAWLAEELAPHASRGLRVHTVEVDVERIGAPEAALLRSAGVVSAETGPQSIGAAALDACRRRFDPTRFAAGVAALRHEGIAVECDLIIGLPGDDAFDVIAGLRWLVQLDPGVIQSSTLRVLPGTDFWDRSAELGVTYEPASEHEVVQTADLSFADIRRLEVMAAALQTEYRARR